jgi:hypothetical protein
MLTLIIAVIAAWLVYNQFKHNKSKWIYVGATVVGVFLFMPFIADFVGGVFTSIAPATDDSI